MTPRAISELPAFLALAALVIMTPGPDTAVTIRSTLIGGRRAGVMTAFGVISGQACWTVAASAGVTALLIASEPAFLVVKFAGAAYLIWLGISALHAAVRGAEHDGHDTLASIARTSPYKQGLLSDLTNPKMAAFFTSLLPQFGSSIAAMLFFGLLFCALTWLWLALYVTVLARLRGVLHRGVVRRVFEAVTGAVLVVLGLKLAAEPRR
jgi:threonine/homoserine/homoserine lactone efflux protein